MGSLLCYPWCSQSLTIVRLCACRVQEAAVLRDVFNRKTFLSRISSGSMRPKTERYFSNRLAFRGASFANGALDCPRHHESLHRHRFNNECVNGVA